MPETWTGNLIGEMHNHKVTYDDLANELGCGKAYISMILNGKRNPQGAEERLTAAFHKVVEKRKKV